MGKSEIMISMITLLVLGFSTVIDIRKKQIRIIPVGVAMIAIFIVQYFEGQNIWMRVISTVGIVLLFLGISKITKEQIGQGDSFLFGLTGAGLGLTWNFMLIYFTFLEAFFVGIFLMVFKKAGKKYEMPLAPFVFGAYLILLTGRVWCV